MNRIQKNITAIEQKYNSLKTAHQLYNQPILFSSIVESLTFGVINEKEVDKYFKQIHSAPKISARQKINEKWYELNFREIFTLLNNILESRSIDKSYSSQISQGQSPKKKKLKQPTSEAHQNPYIPTKITISTKKSIEKQVKNENRLLQNKISLIKKTTQNLHVSPSLGEQTTNHIISDLPPDFQNLSAKDRYAILSKKYGKDKRILEKRFDSIYKHYRKQMYIPYESFQINNELLMDLRIFLKYYREFQVSKIFKTNQAIKHFKKIALNGLWLDDKKFMEIHQKLMNLMEIDEKALDQTSDNNQINETDVQKLNQTSMNVSKQIKNLVQNIISIKQLSDLVSDSKVKQIFNSKQIKHPLKKIVQAHSGLTKDDVMLKLQERVQEKKIKKNFLLGIFNQQKFGQLSPEKVKKNKILEDPTQRLSPSKQSIYEELQIPKLRLREMKKSSVYSSLQALDIQKEKEKLKQLVNERQNEQYLDAFFKKEKSILNLPRSQSLIFSKNQAQNEDSTGGFTINSKKSVKNISRDNLFQRNLSLPRMKFN